jgi:hypothetical protein
MIAKTDYQRDGAGDLVRYIERDKESDNDVALKGPHGQTLTNEERRQFIQRSQDHDMERHFIIAPNPQADYDADEIDQRTREMMNDWNTDRPSAEYVYAVHDHGDKPHAHVAVTGSEHDLYMDGNDIKQFRDQASETFRESERLRESDQTTTRNRQPGSPAARKLPFLQGATNLSQPTQDPAEQEEDNDEERDWGRSY